MEKITQILIFLGLIITLLLIGSCTYAIENDIGQSDYKACIEACRYSSSDDNFQMSCYEMCGEYNYYCEDKNGDIEK